MGGKPNAGMAPKPDRAYAEGVLGEMNRRHRDAEGETRAVRLDAVADGGVVRTPGIRRGGRAGMPQPAARAKQGGRADRLRLRRSRSSAGGLAWRFTTTAAIAGGAFLVWGGGADDSATQRGSEMAATPVTVQAEQVRPVAHRSPAGGTARGADGSGSASSIGRSATAATSRGSAAGESKNKPRSRSTDSSSVGRTAAAATGSSRAPSEPKSTPKGKAKASPKAKTAPKATATKPSSTGHGAAATTRSSSTKNSTKARPIPTTKTTSIGHSAATTTRSTSTNNGTKTKPISKAKRAATAPTSIGRSAAASATTVKATPKSKRAMSIGRSAAAAGRESAAGKPTTSTSIGKAAAARSSGLNCFGSPIRCLTTVPVQNPVTDRFYPFTGFLTAREERMFKGIHHQHLIDSYEDGDLKIFFRPVSYTCTGVTLRCEALGVMSNGELGIARYNRYTPATPPDIGYRAYAADHRSDGLESGLVKFATGTAKGAELYGPNPVAKVGGALVGGLLSFTERNVLEEQREMRAANHASAVEHWRTTPGILNSWRALKVVELTREDLDASNKKLGKQFLTSSDRTPPDKAAQRLPTAAGRGPR